jgi:hypothetical protein
LSRFQSADVAQSFRVSYRYRIAPVNATGEGKDRYSIAYRLTATPIARERDGFRLRLEVSEIEHDRTQDGMDMVIAAALMLEEYRGTQRKPIGSFRTRLWPSLAG